MTTQNLNHRKWVRSSDGWIAGVCQGLGERFGIEPWILRTLWLASIVFFGFGFFLYIGMALSLPKADQIYESPERILGVCYRISVHIDLEVGLVRFIALILLIISGIFPVLIGYILLHFLLSRNFHMN